MKLTGPVLTLRHFRPLQILFIVLRDLHLHELQVPQDDAEGPGRLSRANACWAPPFSCCVLVATPARAFSPLALHCRSVWYVERRLPRWCARSVFWGRAPTATWRVVGSHLVHCPLGCSVPFPLTFLPWPLQSRVGGGCEMRDGAPHSPLPKPARVLHGP